MLCSGMSRWRPAGGWQGTGATHVATNAATQLSRLSRTSKTKLHFKTLHTIAKMLALEVVEIAAASDTAPRLGRAEEARERSR